MPSTTLTISVMFFSTLILNAQERKIARSALPAVVEKTVAAQAQGSTIKGFSTEVEAGKRVYEAETVVSGHTRDVLIALDGTVIEVEEEVSMDALPANVQQALKAKAGAAKIVKVESLTKHGKLVAYEAATRNGVKRGEVQVAPNGETLKRAE